MEAAVVRHQRGSVDLQQPERPTFSDEIAKSKNFQKKKSAEPANNARLRQNCTWRPMHASRVALSAAGRVALARRRPW